MPREPTIRFTRYALWIFFMVDLTIGLLCCFTTYNDREAHFLWTAGEITGVALIIIPGAFVIPAVFNLRHQFREEQEEREEREAEKRAKLSRRKRVRFREAGSRS